jgi:hypothetical protein
MGGPVERARGRGTRKKHGFFLEVRVGSTLTLWEGGVVFRSLVFFLHVNRNFERTRSRDIAG